MIQLGRERTVPGTTDSRTAFPSCVEGNQSFSYFGPAATGRNRPTVDQRITLDSNAATRYCHRRPLMSWVAVLVDTKRMKSILRMPSDAHADGLYAKYSEYERRYYRQVALASTYGNFGWHGYAPILTRSEFYHYFANLSESAQQSLRRMWLAAGK